MLDVTSLVHTTTDRSHGRCTRPEPVRVPAWMKKKLTRPQTRAEELLAAVGSILFQVVATGRLPTLQWRAL